MIRDNFSTEVLIIEEADPLSPEEADGNVVGREEKARQADDPEQAGE